MASRLQQFQNVDVAHRTHDVSQDIDELTVDIATKLDQVKGT